MHLHVLFLMVFASAANKDYEDICGRPVIQPVLSESDRILGGQEAVPGSWPWHAGVFENKTIPDYFCAGALISRKHVVSAAHCFKGMTARQVRVHLGAHLRETRDSGEQYIAVAEICTHPGHDGHNTNDISILTLKSEVDFTNTVLPICLPEDEKEVPDGTDAYLTGWGKYSLKMDKMSPYLKQLRTRTISDERCRNEYNFGVPSGLLCTRHEDGSSCKGDSGGPLVRKVEDRWVLEGVSSGGPRGCGLRDSPMLFTEIPYFVNNFVKRFLNAEDRAQKLRMCNLA